MASVTNMSEMPFSFYETLGTKVIQNLSQHSDTLVTMWFFCDHVIFSAILCSKMVVWVTIFKKTTFTITCISLKWIIFFENLLGTKVHIRVCNFCDTTRLIWWKSQSLLVVLPSSFAMKNGSNYEPIFVNKKSCFPKLTPKDIKNFEFINQTTLIVRRNTWQS